MKAAILAIGTELLGTDRLDTNSLAITASLERNGVDLMAKGIVGDDVEAIAHALDSFAAICDVVVLSGGLGPTADDLTREAVAAWAGVALELDEDLLGDLERRYRRRGRPMPESNRRQAAVPVGAEVLENPRGTAPGLALSHRLCRLFLLPGVPRELQGMLAEQVEPWLEQHRDAERMVEQQELRVACLPESAVEDLIAPAYLRFGREAISVLARPGEVLVRVRARGAEEKRRGVLEEMCRQLRELLGPALFSESGEELEAVVGRLLRDREQSLAVAESCTGGLVGERLTSQAGSSDYFVGGAIAYSNALKVELLGVEPELIERHGAVSEEVAVAMARGARRRMGSDYAVAVTGVAGPGGGSAEKPVGRVHFAVAGPQGAAGEDGELARAAQFPGDRERVRLQAGQFALELVRRALLGLDLEMSGSFALARGNEDERKRTRGKSGAPSSRSSESAALSGERGP